MTRHGALTTLSARLPFGDPLDDAWANVFPAVVAPGCAANLQPLPVDFDMLAAEQAELRDRLARRRPCGFTAAWPDEPAAGLRRAA